MRRQDIAEGSSLGGGLEQRPQEISGYQGRGQQEHGLEGELRELKSFVVTKQPPISESSVRSASPEPYDAPTLTTHKDEGHERKTEVGFSESGNTTNNDERRPLPGGLDMVSSNVRHSTTALVDGGPRTSSAESRLKEEPESANDRPYTGGVTTTKEQQECSESNKCSTRKLADDNAGSNKTSSPSNIQKRAMLSHHKREYISMTGGELTQKSTEERPTGTSYDVTNDSQEFQEITSDEDGDNDENEEDTAGSEEQEDDDEEEDNDEEEDDDDYDGEGGGNSKYGEPEVANYGAPEDDIAEELDDTAEFNKVAEDLLELMVHIAENPTRWQRLASNLKEDGDHKEGFRSVAKRRNLERLKHRHQQREFDWSLVKDDSEASRRQQQQSKQRKSRLRQLMKAGVLPEDDRVLRPLTEGRPGKGGDGVRSRSKAKARQRGRPGRRKLARKSHAKHNGTTTAAEVEVTTRRSLHPQDDEEFLEYARQVAARYQTALTDDVIREKVMQGWKGTPAPEKEKPAYGGRRLPQYDPEAVVSRYKYVLTDEAIREKILQGPRGRYNDTRHRQRPPLPQSRNITIPPFYPERGRNNSSHRRSEERERFGAEQATAGRNGSRLYNVTTRGGVRYDKDGMLPSPGAYHSGRYSTGEEMWQNFVDRALNDTNEVRGWENEQGVRPKQAVASGDGGGVEDNNLPVGPAPQPTPRRLPHFTYHRVTSQPAPRSRHRDAYVAVSVAAPPEGQRQRHVGAAAGAAVPPPGVERATAPTPAVSPTGTTPAPIDVEAIRRVLHMRDPLEEELVEAAVAARQLTRWPAGGGGGGGGGDPGRRAHLWQRLGDVLKLQEETKTLAALEAKLHSAREADQDRVRKILAGDVTAEDGSVRGM